MTMNKQLQQVVDAWPVLSAVTVIVFILLAGFAKTFIVDVVKADISTVPKIISMDTAIMANQVTALAVKEDTEDIKKQISALDAKLTRLIEIMLTED